MLCATACAHELRSPIWPRYPAETPSEDACWPPNRGPSSASIASVASWPARRLASASVAPGREYSCRSRCASSHQRALSRISATSASLLRTIMLSMNGASGATGFSVTSLSDGPA